MAAPHICHVDCRLEVTPEGRRTHVMYAAEPSSAAGRYQWEQNAAIKRQGRRAWRATGQPQSRACREWDHMRRTELDAQRAEGSDGRFLARAQSRATGRRVRELLDLMAHYNL